MTGPLQALAGPSEQRHLCVPSITWDSCLSRQTGHRTKRDRCPMILPARCQPVAKVAVDSSKPPATVLSGLKSKGVK